MEKATITQIVVALIGQIGALLAVLVPRWLDNRKRSERVEVGTAHPANIESPAQAVAPPTTDLLALYLIAAALFTIIVSDALLISGRAPTLSPWTVATPLVGAIIASVVVFLAWRARKGELVVGVMALTAFLVLLFAPGGAFIRSQPDGEHALALWVPLTCLVSLITMATAYTWGSPLLMRGGRRVAFLCLLSVLGLSGSLGVGKQKINELSKDPRNPVNGLSSESIGKVRDELQVMRQLSNADQQAVYRLLSETLVSSVYKQHYFAVAQGLQRQREEESQKGLRRRPVSTDGEEASEYSPNRRNTYDKNYDPARRRERLEIMRNRLLALSKSAGAQYLADRTLWIHLTPADVGSRQADVPVPGTSAEERMKMLGLARVATGLSSLSFEANDYYGLFKYPHDLQFERSTAAIRTTEDRNYYGPIRPPPSDVMLSKLALGHFPELPVSPQLADLQAQLALPDPEERFLAYSLYLKLLHATEDDEKLAHSYKVYADLPEGVQYSFAQYVADPELTPSDTGHPAAVPQRAATDAVGAEEIRAEKWRIVSAVSDDIAKSVERLEGDPRAASGLADKIASPDCGIILSKEKQPPNTDPYVGSGHVNGASAFDNNSSANHNDLDTGVLAKSKGEPAKTTTPRLTDDEYRNIADVVCQKLKCRGGADAPCALMNKMLRSNEMRRLDDSGGGSVFEMFRGGDFLREIGTLNDIQRKRFFDGVADPIAATVVQVAKFSRGDGSQEGTKEGASPLLARTVSRLLKLDAKEREALLHSMAIAQFRPHGEYSLNPVDLLYARLGVMSGGLALLFATALALPWFVLAVLVGSRLARFAANRDRLTNLAAVELKRDVGPEYQQGVAVDLVGREDALRSLSQLVRRGWGTIGLVGRRGVGKTRILYDLYRAAITRRSGDRLGVWISAPTRFGEEEFVAAALEQLATATERAVGRTLGAEPREVRLLRARLAQSLLFAAVIAAVLLGLLVFEVTQKIQRSELLITLLPASMVAVAAALALLLHWAKRQPVNLTSWLERDRANRPHTALLYREASASLGRASSSARAQGVLKFVSYATLTTPIFIAVLLAMEVSIREPERSAWGTVAIALAAVGIFIQIRPLVTPRSRRPSSLGLMALVQEYRSLASSIVYRLREGALGEPNPNAAIVFCVDELDKMGSAAELRPFLRRVKAIFEIPGVYYYLSVAEDAARELRLGASQGKSEVDSALDHIVELEPLPFAAAGKMALEYLRKERDDACLPELASAVAAAAFGVARDILRQCDEYLASQNEKPLAATTHVGNLRRHRLAMAKDGGQLSVGLAQSLARSASEARMTARQNLALANRESGERLSLGEPAGRVLAEAWVLALIECSIERNETHTDRLARLMRVGYGIPLRGLAETAQAIRAIDDELETSASSTDRRRADSPVDTIS